MENYIEHLVKGKRGTKEYMERGVAIALPFLCCAPSGARF